MKSTDKVQRLLRRAAVTTSSAPDDAVFENLRKAYTGTVRHESAQQRPSMWRFVMKSPLTKLAVAAAVVVACAIGLSLWKATGSGIALADVLARLEKVKAFGCKGTIKAAGHTTPDKPYQWEMYYTILTSQEHGLKVRREAPGPNGEKVLFGEAYFEPQTKTFVQIAHTEKKYTRTELDDTEIRRGQKEFSRYTDPRGFLQEIMACKYESLGRSTVDSIDAEGFGTTDPNCRGAASGIKNPQVEIKVWIDVRTRLPVRYESRTRGLNEMGGKSSFEFVMHDFQWDVPVVAAEFEPPAVPDGYMLLVEKSPGPVNEETTVQALSQCVELLGKYPGSLSVALPRGLQVELDKSDRPAAVKLKEELKGLTEQERIDRLMDVGMPLRRLSRFYVGLVDDRKDPGYYGMSVTAQDADKVLMRWKVSDSEYRVIYGDLHAETVSPERLTELEASLPR
jgi:hypothetical protein